MDRKENAGNNTTAKKINGKQQDDNDHNGGLPGLRTPNSFWFSYKLGKAYNLVTKTYSAAFEVNVLLAATRNQSSLGTFDFSFLCLQLRPMSSLRVRDIVVPAQIYRYIYIEHVRMRISQRKDRNKPTALVSDDVSAERTRKGTCASDIGGHEVELAAHPEVTSRTAGARKVRNFEPGKERG
uniref:Uncharacterized protein n=1 Tax=Glossina pallidipes TaxID=7398 RepID=A0A1A9ZIW0_GLOPL